MFCEYWVRQAMSVLNATRVSRKVQFIVSLYPVAPYSTILTASLTSAFRTAAHPGTWNSPSLWNDDFGNYGDGVDGAPTGIDVPRWSLSQPIRGRTIAPQVRQEAGVFQPVRDRSE